MSESLRLWALQGAMSWLSACGASGLLHARAIIVAPSLNVELLAEDEPPTVCNGFLRRLFPDLTIGAPLGELPAELWCCCPLTLPLPKLRLPPPRWLGG